jgi:hypothetical protein
MASPHEAPLLPTYRRVCGLYLRKTVEKRPQRLLIRRTLKTTTAPITIIAAPAIITTTVCATGNGGDGHLRRSRACWHRRKWERATAGCSSRSSIGHPLLYPVSICCKAANQTPWIAVMSILVTRAKVNLQYHPVNRLSAPQLPGFRVISILLLMPRVMKSICLSPLQLRCPYASHVVCSIYQSL